jgi:adenylosuccinate lyase
VQKHALDSLENNNCGFKQRLYDDYEVTSRLTPNEIEECFDTKDYLKNIDNIFLRILG